MVADCIIATLECSSREGHLLFTVALPSCLSPNLCTSTCQREELTPILDTTSLIPRSLPFWGMHMQSDDNVDMQVWSVTSADRGWASRGSTSSPDMRRYQHREGLV